MFILQYASIALLIGSPGRHAVVALEKEAKLSSKIKLARELNAQNFSTKLKVIWIYFYDIKSYETSVLSWSLDICFINKFVIFYLNTSCKFYVWVRNFPSFFKTNLFCCTMFRFCKLPSKILILFLFNILYCFIKT